MKYLISKQVWFDDSGEVEDYGDMEQSIKFFNRVSWFGRHRGASGCGCWHGMVQMAWNTPSNPSILKSSRLPCGGWGTNSCRSSRWLQCKQGRRRTSRRLCRTWRKLVSGKESISRGLLSPWWILHDKFKLWRKNMTRLYLVTFITILVSSHMYPENPEGTRVIVGSMNMGYDIYPTLPTLELLMLKYFIKLFSFYPQ